MTTGGEMYFILFFKDAQRMFHWVKIKVFGKIVYLHARNNISGVMLFVLLFLYYILLILIYKLWVTPS